MNRQQRKRHVRALVVGRQLEQLAQFAETDRRVLAVLSGLLYDQEELFRWRAIEALGVASEAVASFDEQAVREMLRRLEWLMNDESGGAGWHSPEAMAAIVVYVPELADVFGVLLGARLSDESLSVGAHWAAAAIAPVRPKVLEDRVGELICSLSSPDPFVRGCAAVALAPLDRDAVSARTESLRADSGTLNLYSRESGLMHSTSVGELVKLVISNDSRGSHVSIW